MVDFKNTLIIMTSNVGSSVIEKGGQRLGFQLVSEESEEERSYNRIKSLVRAPALSLTASRTRKASHIARCNAAYVGLLWASAAPSSCSRVYKCTGNAWSGGAGAELLLVWNVCHICLWRALVLSSYRCRRRWIALRHGAQHTHRG